MGLRLQCGYNILRVIIFGLWEMCKYRCRLVFKGGELDPQFVIRVTIHNLQAPNNSCIPKRRHMILELCVARSLFQVEIASEIEWTYSVDGRIERHELEELPVLCYIQKLIYVDIYNRFSLFSSKI